MGVRGSEYLFQMSYTAGGAEGLRREGGAVTMKTTVLIDPETVDAAVKRTVNYRPPRA